MLPSPSYIKKPTNRIRTQLIAFEISASLFDEEILFDTTRSDGRNFDKSQRVTVSLTLWGGEVIIFACLPKRMDNSRVGVFLKWRLWVGSSRNVYIYVALIESR